MIYGLPDTELQPITVAYLATLTTPELTDLFLSRSKLFMVIMSSQMADKEYVQSIREDIQAIHAAIKSRE